MISAIRQFLRRVGKTRLLIGGGLFVAAALAAGLYLFTGESEREKRDRLAYQKRKQAIDAYSSEIANIYAGEARRFGYQPGTGQTLRVGYRHSAQAEVNMNFLVEAMNPAAGKKEMNTREGLEALFGERQKSTIAHDGTLHLKFYPAGKGKWRVGAILKNINYRVNGKESPLIKALAQPFAFEMNDRGFFSAFRFTRGVPQQVRQIQEQTIYLMQVGLPGKAKNTWKMKEFDSEGYYLARYGVTELNKKEKTARLVKKKIKYLRGLKFSDNSTVMRSLREGKKEITKSETKIQLGFSATWPRLVVSRQSDVSQSRGGHTWGTGDYSFRAQNSGQSSNHNFPAGYAAFRKSLESNRYLKYKYYETDPFLNRMGEGRDTSQAVEVFQKLYQDQSKRSLARKFILNYLRQNPAAGRELITLLDGATNKDISEDNQHTLWRLVAKAGHEEAQRAITSAYAPSYKPLSNYRAVAYSHDVENPQPFMVDDLDNLHRRVRFGDTNDERELASMSLYSIGGLGGPEKLNQETRRKSAKYLRNYLKTVDKSDSQLERDIINAMGNHGSDSLLPVLKQKLSDKNPAIRQAAYDAMRQMKSDKAQAIMRKFAGQEKNTNLKAGAITTLSKMPYRDSTFEWVEETMNQTSDESIRLAIARYLGTNLKHNDDAIRLLNKLADQSKSVETKSMIYKYISP